MRERGRKNDNDDNNRKVIFKQKVDLFFRIQSDDL